MTRIVDVASLAALVTAAYYWWKASEITVPDNQDTFIAALQKIGRFSKRASIANVFAAVFTGLSMILRW
jgi:hypothetical protein